MKNILVFAHDDEGQESRFQVALDLGRALGGHLTCLDVTYVPPIAGGGGYYDGGYTIAALMTEETTKERANKIKLEQRLAREDVSWDWIDATGDPAECITQAASLADVIVVSRKLDDGSVIDMRRTASELIVKSGKPVLAVPGDCRRLDLSSALVAWDGSPCAAAALRAAVPLLQLTDRVDLLEVQDGSIVSPVEDAASYLSRYSIHATVRRATAGPEGPAKLLLDEVAGGRFGYLVMGGFGHLRFVEALFGGVTRAMLGNSPVPLFLAH